MFSVISKAKFPSSSSELVTKLGNSVTSGPSLVDNDKLISSSKSDFLVWSVMLVVPSTERGIENSSLFPKVSLKLAGVGRSVLIGMVTATSGSVSSEVAPWLELGISIFSEPELSSTELSTSNEDPETSFDVAIVLVMMSKLSILKTSSSCGGFGSIWSPGFWVLWEKGIVTISSSSEISKLGGAVVCMNC